MVLGRWGKEYWKQPKYLVIKECRLNKGLKCYHFCPSDGTNPKILLRHTKTLQQEIKRTPIHDFALDHEIH